MNKYSSLVRASIGATTLVAVLLTSASQTAVFAQSASGDLHTDPATGIVYRKVKRVIQRPVVEQTYERKHEIVYRPETVKETRPEFKTTYSPVTEMKWESYVDRGWNPFAKPKIAYRQVPETRWETRNEVVNRTTTETRWVKENRTIEVPHSIVRYENEHRVDYQPIARVMPQPSVGGAVDSAVASRLRPIDANAPFAGFGTPVPPDSSMQVATSPSSTQSLRSPTQSGMRTNVLLPQGGAGAKSIPGTSGIGIATVPAFSTRR